MTEQSLELKLLRIRSGLKLVELAKRAGLNYSALSLIENGWRPLKKSEADSLIRAYRGFQIEAEDLIRAHVA